MPILEESWQTIADTLGYHDEEEMLKDFYIKRNMSINEISRVVGYSAFNVRRRLIMRGVPLRKRGGPNHAGMRKLKNLTDEMLRSASAEQLAVALGVNPSTVYAERRIRKCNSLQLSQEILSGDSVE